MTYLDRIQKQITLISPSGQVFNAKWSGDARSGEKQLGIFKTPGVKGIKTQDLEIGAIDYPLTFFFDGPDNDLISNDFMTACAELGEWTVEHPVHGSKVLQIVSFSEAVQPISSGNVTQFTTVWFEATEDSGTISAAQFASLTKAQVSVLNETATEQLNDVVSLDTADKAGKFRTSVNNTVKAFDNTLKPITDTVSEVQAQASSIKRGIDVAIAETPIDVIGVAGQIQALIGLPNLVVTDITSKIDTYRRFIDFIFNDSPTVPSQSGINTVAVMEVSQTAALGSISVASVSTGLDSRQSVIDNLNANIDLFKTVIEGLDDVQEVYSEQLLSRSYFSQSQSFSDAARMVGLTLAYLIKSAFDLSVEKRIILTKEENPVMVAMREYGGPGDGDENINLFYSSNGLTGQETLLMPVGKEVVVYL